MAMELIPPQFLLSLLSLIALCSLEESLELSSLGQSQILCNFFRLSIEIVASVLRIPVRLLVCVRVFKVSALEDFNRLAKHVAATFDLRTKDEFFLLGQVSQDEQDQVKHDEYMLRVQRRLARALDDTSKLRRDNLALSSRLNDIQAERASILCAVEELARPDSNLSAKAAQESEHNNLADIPFGSGGGHDALASVRGRFEHLEQEFREQQAQCSYLERELQNLQDDYHRLSRELVSSRASHQKTKNRLHILLQNFRNFQRYVRQVDSQRLKTIRTLLLTLLFFRRFTRLVGTRLARSVNSQNRILSRWKTVSSQKVAARRELIKAVNAKQELRRKLDIQIGRRQHHEKWHDEFHKSVKARESAAKKFKAFYLHAISRYSSTTVQLLSGILVLWRFSLILSQQLAEARILARALEESAVAHEKAAADMEKTELRTRVARVEEKIKAMESVDAAYLQILLQQTRSQD